MSTEKKKKSGIKKGRMGPTPVALKLGKKGPSGKEKVQHEDRGTKQLSQGCHVARHVRAQGGFLGKERRGGKKCDLGLSTAAYGGKRKSEPASGVQHHRRHPRGDIPNLSWPCDKAAL